MQNVFYAKGKLPTVTMTQVARVKRAAQKSELRRARLCLHGSANDAVHEMVIAMCRNTYVRPHRHKNKSESFHVISGALRVFLFNEAGRILRKIDMGVVGTGNVFLFRNTSQLWHSVVPLTPVVVLHETTNGPFIPVEAQFAPWAPSPDDKPAVRKFLKKLS